MQLPDTPTEMLQVAREAEGHVMQLLSLIKLPALNSLPGSVAIVAVKAMGVIAQQRPQFLGRILPTLLSIAAAANLKTEVTHAIVR